MVDIIISPTSSILNVVVVFKSRSKVYLSMISISINTVFEHNSGRDSPTTQGSMHTFIVSQHHKQSWSYKLHVPKIHETYNVSTSFIDVKAPLYNNKEYKIIFCLLRHIYVYLDLHENAFMILSSPQCQPKDQSCLKLTLMFSFLELNVLRKNSHWCESKFIPLRCFWVLMTFCFRTKNSIW